MDKLRLLFKRSWRAKKALFFLLRTPFIARNPVYRKLYLRNVNKRIPRMAPRPNFVIIENTNHCNISCIFCAHREMKREKGFIDRALFEDIVSQCVRIGVRNVLIQGYGEPLLDKDYVGKVQFAKSQGIENVHCVTNGILLSEEVSRGLIEVGLDRINISIDASCSETYGRIHRTVSTGGPSDKFDVVLRNIESLARLRESCGSRKPSVQVRFKDFELNKGELKAFVRRYAKQVDEINVYMNITNWPGSATANNLPDSLPILKFPCSNLWSSLFIGYDGTVGLCCQDYECRFKLGDARRKPLMDIWNGAALKSVRRLHLKGEFDKNPVCKDCVVNTHYVNPWW